MLEFMWIKPESDLQRYYRIEYKKEYQNNKRLNIEVTDDTVRSRIRSTFRRIKDII